MKNEVKKALPISNQLKKFDSAKEQIVKDLVKRLGYPLAKSDLQLFVGNTARIRSIDGIFFENGKTVGKWDNDSRLPHSFKPPMKDFMVELAGYQIEFDPSFYNS